MELKKPPDLTSNYLLKIKLYKCPLIRHNRDLKNPTI